MTGRADHLALLSASLAALSPKARRTMAAAWAALAGQPAARQRQRKRRKLHKPRRPSIGTMIAQADKAGKPLASITLADGTKLEFGKATASDGDANSWDEVLNNAPDSKRPS